MVAAAGSPFGHRGRRQGNGQAQHLDITVSAKKSDAEYNTADGPAKKNELVSHLLKLPFNRGLRRVGIRQHALQHSYLC